MVQMKRWQVAIMVVCHFYSNHSGLVTSSDKKQVESGKFAK